MNKYWRMGDWFVQEGLITPAQLEKAVVSQKDSNLRFGEILVALGFASEDDVVRCLAEQYDYPIADLSKTRSQPGARQLVTPSFALTHLLLPVSVDDVRFGCVLADPCDLPVIDDFRRAIGRRLEIQLAPPSALFAAIAHAYRLPHDAVTRKTPAPLPSTPKHRRPVVPQLDRSLLLDELETALKA